MDPPTLMPPSSPLPSPWRDSNWNFAGSGQTRRASGDRAKPRINHEDP